MIRSQHKPKSGATCDLCGSEEEKLRPVGRYIVKLKLVEIDVGAIRVCQACYRKHYRVGNLHKSNYENQPNPGIKHILPDRIASWMFKLTS